MRALVNGYFRGSCPKELSELNRTERSLIALVNVFSKISLLAQGGAYASNGNCYAMINKVSEIAKSLPQLPSIGDMAFIRSRNETDKVPREYMYSPFKVRRALDWLKDNNPLYANKVADTPKEGDEEAFWNSAEEHHIPFIDDAPPPRAHLTAKPPSSSSSSSADKAQAGNDDSNMSESSDDEFEPDECDGDATQGGSTNAGEPGAARDILLCDGDDVVPDIAEQVKRVLNDKDEPEVTSIRDANGRYLSDYNTPNFLAMAFPWLYPYGRGCAGMGTHIKVDKFYFRHVLKYGGDRAFQKCSNFIFYSYSWIMKSAVGVISNVVAKRQEASIVEELTKKRAMENSTTTTSSSSSSSSSSNSTTTSTQPGARKERAVSRGLTKEQLIRIKSYLNNEPSDESVVSKEEIKILLQRLIPFAKDVKGSSMYFQRERRNLLSMISSPSTIADGEWRLFFTEAQASIYLPEIYDNIVTSAG